MAADAGDEAEGVAFFILIVLEIGVGYIVGHCVRVVTGGAVVG